MSVGVLIVVYSVTFNYYIFVIPWTHDTWHVDCISCKANYLYKYRGSEIWCYMVITSCQYLTQGRQVRENNTWTMTEVLCQ